MTVIQKIPESFVVGEMLDVDGEVGMVLGFEVDGEMTHYNLHPAAAVDIVNAMSAWLDNHDPRSA